MTTHNHTATPHDKQLKNRRMAAQAGRALPWLATALLVSGIAACDDTQNPSVGSYEAAATVCGSGPTVEGVDVSTYQGSIDWHAVKAAGREFGIARVSDGTGNHDGTFAGNWSGMKAAGLIRGAYQFFRPEEDPIAQANIMISAIGTLGAGDLPPMIDVEVTDGQSKATMVAKIHQWIDHVQQATGRVPMIYVGKYFWNDNVGSSDFGNNPLVHAQYTSASCPDIATGWSKWTIWQYSDAGHVAGINGGVDSDRFNGTLADLQALAAGGGGADWGAQFVSQSFPYASQGPVTLHVGDSVDAFIEMKNTGAKAWDSNTRLAVTPRDQPSALAGSDWMSPTRVAAVTGTVMPGQTFKFQFKVHGNTAGDVDQFFGLVQEGVAWFADSGGPADNVLEGKFTVLPGPPDAATDGGTPPPPPPPADHDGGTPTGGEDAGSHGGHDAGVTHTPGVDAGTAPVGSSNDQPPGARVPSATPSSTMPGTQEPDPTALQGGCNQTGGAPASAGTALCFLVALAMIRRRRVD